MLFSMSIPMSWVESFEDRRIKVFWVLGLTALFVHGVADPAVTYFIVNVFGVGAEANPFLAPPLEKGAVPFILIHLPLYAGVCGACASFTWLFSCGSETEKQRLYRLSILIWPLIIVWGVFLVANNLIVLVSGG